MEARRIDHKTYVDAEWLLDQYDTLKDTEKEEAVWEAYMKGQGAAIKELAIKQNRTLEDIAQELHLLPPLLESDKTDI